MVQNAGQPISQHSHKKTYGSLFILLRFCTQWRDDTPRSEIVSNETANWHHVVNRSVRRAYLCGDGFEHRKEMIRQRLIHLSQIFSIEIASYAIMDNHLHIIMRLDPKGADQFSAREVLRAGCEQVRPHGIGLMKMLCHNSMRPANGYATAAPIRQHQHDLNHN